MRIEDINKKNIKQAKDSELYSLKLRIQQVWQKLVKSKNVERKTTGKIQDTQG